MYATLQYMDEQRHSVFVLLLCRGDFGIDVGRNIIHGSDGVEVMPLHMLHSDC